jgi:hypothetical protein
VSEYNINRPASLTDKQIPVASFQAVCPMPAPDTRHRQIAMPALLSFNAGMAILAIQAGVSRKSNQNKKTVNSKWVCPSSN